MVSNPWHHGRAQNRIIGVKDTVFDAPEAVYIYSTVKIHTCKLTAEIDGSSVATPFGINVQQLSY